MRFIRELSITEEQDLQLCILRHFIDICNRENITYFLAYGTLLGAIRECGFIKWDDDIDIWMTRNNYDRFMNVYRDYEKAPFFLQTYKTDPHCLSPEMMRICVDSTYKWPIKYKNLDFNKGIYFDIFPLDYGFGDWRDKYYMYKMKMCLYLLTSRCLGTSDFKHPNPIKRILYKILYFINNEEALRHKILSIVKKFSNNKDSGVTLCFPSGYAGERRCFFSSDLFRDATMVSFEGVDLPAPKRHKELLTYMYGVDYMTPINTKPDYTHAYCVEE